VDRYEVGGDGYLYFTSNQLHRQPSYRNGREMRRKPCHLFRMKIDAVPSGCAK
jgi:hypothetical protein